MEDVYKRQDLGSKKPIFLIVYLTGRTPFLILRWPFEIIRMVHKFSLILMECST